MNGVRRLQRPGYPPPASPAMPDRRMRPVITTEGSVLDLIDELDVERLAKAFPTVWRHLGRYPRHADAFDQDDWQRVAEAIAREYARLSEAES